MTSELFDHKNLTENALPPLALGQKKKVLIIDDHPESVGLLRFALDRWGLKTKVVCDGYDAIIEMVMHTYDLVIIDWVMPEMSGHQTLVQANKSVSLDPKSDPKSPMKRQIPVVVYSSYQPDLKSLESLDHFKVIGHWNKAQQFRSILSHVYDTIKTI